MSEALDYLLKVRPEAMGHYFAFLREAGRHLDPKTRSLISVITKVHAQTEAGLRQYVRRALADGARPAEVIDALLMAFPALGLTRIVWAIDVLLKMDLPEFRADAVLGETGWHAVCTLDALAVGSTVRIDVEGEPLLVHRAEDGVRIYDARCPHRGVFLCEPAAGATRLVCPRHGWVFELRDGQPIEGDAPLREIPHRVDAGTILAYW
jgi:nitrite reductase/ring-hydroxylating ferredoxin subunit/alkylhydroperoxidase/carboxymuconolactone decarboxylase family protein YurZ